MFLNTPAGDGGFLSGLWPAGLKNREILHKKTGFFQERPMRRTLAVFYLVLSLSLCSCFSRRADFSVAERALKEGRCAPSFKRFSRLTELKEKHRSFALRAGRFCSAKDPETAVLFYERWLREQALLFKGAPSAQKKIQAVEKTLAGLFFYKLKNYEKAVFYYDRLLREKGLSEGDRLQSRFNLAESFFRLEKPSQSLLETEKILKQNNLSPKNRQKALDLKGSLLMALKDYEKAKVFFENQIKRFPERTAVFRQYLTLIFETQGKYDQAIEELEKSPSSAPRKKIESLKRQKAARPKAKVRE